MDGAPRQFFEQLLATPGVSGYEEPVQQVVASYAKDFVDSHEIDLHGNLILAKNPQKPIRLMLAGHADQIGLLVSRVDDTGVLYTTTVGGWDPQQLIGHRVTVWSRTGPVPGVISRKAIHLQTEDERKRATKAEDLWIDIGAIDKQDALSRVSIGDSVTMGMGLNELQNQLVTAPALDNRCGVWVVVEALRRAEKLNDNCSMYAVSTVQEEIGLRGAKTAAYAIAPQIGIAVDVTHATDSPNIAQNYHGEVSLGKGPVIFRGPNINPRVAERLMSICESEGIPYQVAALGRAAPNDSNSLQVTRGGVATGLVSIPNRYMHSAVEVVSLEDLDRAATLLAHFATSITDVEEFVPGVHSR